MGMKIYSQLNFKKKEKMEKNGNKKEKKQKEKLHFQNFEDKKNWKNKGKTKEIFRTNIIKEIFFLTF